MSVITSVWSSYGHRFMSTDCEDHEACLTCGAMYALVEVRHQPSRGEYLTAGGDTPRQMLRRHVDGSRLPGRAGMRVLRRTCRLRALRTRLQLPFLRMIHIDISRDRAEVKAGLEWPKILIQTSTDGAGWATQYTVYAQVGLLPDDEMVRRDQENRAADTARTFAQGCRYAGADVRLTMFGYAL